MTTFGVSAPSEQAFAHFGITAANIAAKANKLAEAYPHVRFTLEFYYIGKC